MDASEFDPKHAPTLSVEEGYKSIAPLYDDRKASVSGMMDYWLLERSQSVPWNDIHAAADLACGTGRIGAWLKDHGAGSLDGVDLTEAMLEQARAKNIYERLYLSDLRQTPLQASSYDLVSVSLADDHLPEVLPLYQEAARLSRPGGYLILISYHPFFQLSGIPTTFELDSGAVITVEGYIHLFSEHVQAANACGWQLREMYERLIDDEWIALRPHAARRKGWPVSFLCVWQR